jgi:asparagine synthase (glutamine-hydrolysing)
MCGIFLYCGTPTDPQALRECFLRSQHRGPDNTQFIVYYINDTMLAFGFHRLSINGLSAKAHQPMFVDHTITMCNGEIWNSDEIHRACDTLNESGSDCECLPLYYRDVLSNISQTSRVTGIPDESFDTLCSVVDGVFGLVMFDRIRNTVYVARDKIGIRSLYYATDSTTGSLYVASELKSIPPLLQNAVAFPPGHWASVDLNNAPSGSFDNHPKPYWTLRTTRRMAYLKPYCPQSELANDTDYQDCCAKLEMRLIEAVKKRFMSERPIGCVLSGGLDSTVITAIACRLHNERRPNAPPMRTYTIGMAGAEDFEWARMAAEYLGTDHREFVLTEQDFLDAIPDVIAQIESYDVTTVRASTGNWLLAKKIAEQEQDTVLFCGDVADELLGGYRGFGMTTDADAFDDENVKMLENIHRFDVLRCEKSFAGHGLEARVPFADGDVVDLLMSVPPEFKMWDGTVRIEKDLLRRAFQSYLPDALVWRRKEAFSDGVSQKEKSWFQIIQDKLADEAVAQRSHASPYDAESTYYREIYETMYSSVKNIPYLWKQPFSDVADPSARCLENYEDEK